MNVNPKIREGTAAILISTDGRLLFQLRDNILDIPDPGKLDFFGGGREGDESFLECVVREVHEETGVDCMTVWRRTISAAL